MKRMIWAVCLWLTGALAAAAQQAWVQVEAQPTLAEAQAAARDYSARLDGVGGYDLGNSWFAIALGPFDPETAEATLNRLRSAGAIPRDSYISRGESYGAQFFPEGPSGSPAATAEAPAETATQPADEAVTQPADETAAQARRSERLLTRDERMRIQTALEWAGVYEGAIDAAFGPSTRSAMADWQDRQGYARTGFLTTAQRTELLESYRSVLDDVGLEIVSDSRAGVEVAMPTDLVSFSRYAPPLAYYEADGQSPAQVILISRPGDAATLRGLYDVMQSLEIVPPEGPREYRGRSFTLEGRNDRIVSTTHAELAGDAVKGFTLVWPADDEARRRRVLEEMRASFRPLPGSLPAEADEAPPPSDLLASLETEQPERARTGFFVDSDGSVLTTAEAVVGCRRLTLGDGMEAETLATDERIGLALLRPRGDLTPAAHARFDADAPRPQSRLAVAGYPFGGALAEPSLSFGRLVATDGSGSEGRQRLALAAEPGDTGGPILNDGGAVVGLLQRHEADAQARSGEAAVGTGAAAIARFLSDHGISAAASEEAAVIPPEDLTRLAADMTVLVNCRG